MPDCVNRIYSDATRATPGGLFQDRILLDDVAIALNFSITPPLEYWFVMELLYPICAVVAFFLFGKANQPKKQPTIAS